MTCLTQSWGQGADRLKQEQGIGAGGGTWTRSSRPDPPVCKTAFPTTATQGQWLCLGLLGKGHRLYPTSTENGNGCIKVLLPAALWVRDGITVWVGPSTRSSLIFQIPPVPNSENLQP